MPLLALLATCTFVNVAMPAEGTCRREHRARRELAIVLDIPEGTVRSRLRRAREQLEAKMVELADDRRILSSTRNGLETWVSDLKALVVAAPAERS